MNERFNENRIRLEDFGDSFLVVCPDCSKRAHVTNRGTNANPEVTLACTECGRAQVWRSAAPGVMTSSRLDHYQPGHVCIGAAVDWYFHLPLWLQLTCCGQTLWAYNEAHLRFLEQYVSAGMRERRRDGDLGWSNQSLASRLPAWMKAANNRREIIKCLARLKQKLV